METNSRVELKQEEENYSKGLLKIRDKIRDPQIKIVSFDVFDTLLFRPVLTPVDIFRLLENKLDIPNFHNMRVTAEAEARRYKSIYVQDITLEEIYETYAHLFGLTEGESKALMQEELDVEYTLLYARKSAKYLYQQALEAGKEIIIISDMYLPGDFIDTVLKKNGYEGYTHIYVSSETGVLKSTKLMYRLVLDDLKIQSIKPCEVLHIGDNKRADVDSAIASGMNAMHLPKPADIKNNCMQLKRIDSFILMDWMNSNNAMLFGILINMYFDDPFIEFHRSTYFNGDAKLMGYWFAPLMIAFTKWMIESVEKEGIEQLLWVWRDGYLPAQLFQLMRPCFTERSLEVKKIYMGRDLRMPFSALDCNVFFNSFTDNPINEKCTVDYFIRNRLLCRDNESQYNQILNIFLRHGYLNKESEIGRFNNYRGFLNELEPYFIENTRNVIELYSKYIEQNIDRNKKIAIFDRSPRGKSSRFLDRYFSIKSVCYTTDVYDTPKAKLEDVDSTVKSYLEYGRWYINRMGNIWAQIFEITISDRAPGFKDVIENDDGTYSVQLNTQVQNEKIIVTDEIVAKIQGAIMEFATVVVNSLGKYLPYMIFDRHGFFDYVTEPLNAPHLKDAEMIAGIYPGTSILAPIDENVFVNWYNRKIRKPASISVQKKKPYDYIRHAGYVTAEKLGILLPARTLYRNIIGDPLEPVISAEKIQSVTDRHIEYIDNLNCSNINAIFCGGGPQEVGSYFNKLLRMREDLHFMFVAAGFNRAPTWFDFPCIAGPDIFSFWGLEGQELRIKVPEEIRKAVNEKIYLKELARRRMLKGYSESVSVMLAYETERYFTALINKVKPRLFMVWNYWGNNSNVPREICRSRGIPVISVERGFLEGTMMFSADGYGRDFINVNPEEFRNLPVNSEELNKAQNIVDFLEDSGFNRYNQPVNNTIENLKERLNNGKKNILLAGSFDCENPAYPINEVYSPTFDTSRGAMKYVAKLAKKNGWNLIYKPHPLMVKIDKSKDRLKNPSNVIYVTDININRLIDLADVVICLVSGVSYITLTRRKPLVELAYTPLKGKGCCYEPKNISDIEASIKDAIKNGYTNEQETAFVRHIAQVSEYYYFDDLSIRPIRYGRSIEEAGALLDKLIEEQKEKQSK